MKNDLKQGIIVSLRTIFLAFLLVITPFANSSQRIQKKEIPQDITREMNRISGLLQPTALQKAEQAKKVFQKQVFSQLEDRDISRMMLDDLKEMDLSQIASDSLLAEFMKLNVIENDVLVSWIMYETALAAEEDIQELADEIDKMHEAKKKLRRQIRLVTNQIKESQSKQVESRKSKTEKKPVKTRVKVSRIQSRPQLKKTRHLGITYHTTPVVYDLSGTDGVTIQGLKSLLDDLKGKLDGMNEMSEMTSLRLQMTMDRRSKFISTLSQMMKKISTTQDILIQNIK